MFFPSRVVTMDLLWTPTCCRITSSVKVAAGTLLAAGAATKAANKLEDFKFSGDPSKQSLSFPQWRTKCPKAISASVIL
ncbi:hypothetical protein BGZ61DRAFT_465098 [Ilyonectria robusta]|uniref:uncharacterized protein n=1 Tax=Ilyonectria robusta TaxID=1079257 RepID=UPI001E8EAD71|nr:uncharacterized protein BGZ61DRAFT_465098 [Ilyonectria robusta]KAH8659531.1 hypothetical protein BGZ61DRAFT_465098 [Ilyonectria robusta]